MCNVLCNAAEVVATVTTRSLLTMHTRARIYMCVVEALMGQRQFVHNNHSNLGYNSDISADAHAVVVLLVVVGMTHTYNFIYI